jgi:hypothetical protein
MRHFGQAVRSAGLAAVAGILAAMAAAPAGAATILFNNFSDLSPLQVNGATRTIHGCAASGVGSTCGTVTGPSGGNVLRLTNNLSQSGSAFSTTTVSLDANASFSTAFRFQITDQQNTGADGIVFVVQTVANNVGGGGGGIGYQGVSNSVGIEFDNWDNGLPGDINGNHVGIDLNGSVASVTSANLSPLFLDGGAVFTAWVDYNGATDLLEVRVSTDGVRPAAAILSHTVDLVTVLGSTNAFVGFTSGTGAAGADHDILSWQFNSTFNPIEDIGDIPEPAPLAAIALGLIGLAALRRRKG